MDPGPNRRRLLATGAAAAGAAALPGPLSSISSAADGSAARPPAKPTIVLVHGRLADTSCWNGVIERLQHAGYETIQSAVGSSLALGSRHDAFEVLAALRERIETTPWRGERGRTAVRVLRAHLNIAETAGGPLHHASERQTA